MATNLVNPVPPPSDGIAVTYTTRSGEVLTTIKPLRIQPSFVLSQAPEHPVMGIAVLGYGFHGRRNVKNIYNNQGCMVRFIVEDEPEKVAIAQQDIKELEIENTQVIPFSSLPQALNSRDVMFVIVSSKTEMKNRHVREALLADKHVMVDKPIATSIDHAREMFELARKRSKTLLATLPGRPGKSFSKVIMSLISSASKITVERLFDAGSPRPGKAINAEDPEVQELLVNMAYHDCFAINFCMCMRPYEVSAKKNPQKQGAVILEFKYHSGCTAIIYGVLGQFEKENQIFNVSGEKLNEMRRVDHMNINDVPQSGTEKGFRFTQVYDFASKDALEQMYTAASGRTDIAIRVSCPTQIRQPSPAAEDFAWTLLDTPQSIRLSTPVPMPKVAYQDGCRFKSSLPRWLQIRLRCRVTDLDSQAQRQVRPQLMEQNVVDCLKIAESSLASLRQDGAVVPIQYW